MTQILSVQGRAPPLPPLMILIFGGMTSVMTERIDHPQHGFRWRGERMEWAFARALHLIASHPEA